MVRRRNWSDFGVCVLWGHYLERLLWKYWFACRTMPAVWIHSCISILHFFNCSGGNILTAPGFKLEPPVVETVVVSTCWQPTRVAFANHPAPSALQVLSCFLLFFLFAIVGSFLLCPYSRAPFGICLVFKKKKHLQGVKLFAVRPSKTTGHLGLSI